MSTIQSQPDTTTCQILDWDSTFFGRRIARYRLPRCLRDDVGALVVECEARDIECVYVLVHASDTDSIINLQQMRAHFTDIRVTFGAPVPQPVESSSMEGSPVRVRPAAGSDIAALTRIASVSHRDTRFYADTHFSPERCDRLYEVWIENSCRGYADAVLVAEGAAGGPVGYVTCHKNKAADTGHIGLLAVSEQAQARGVGSALLRAALAWFATNHVTAMTVVTQLRNLRAVRFYGRGGLFMTTAELWFHFWPRDIHV
jgi:dTDP-4-amino-4,6-dideoxy-D-galactose acyltransferase